MASRVEKRLVRSVEIKLAVGAERREGQGVKFSCAAEAIIWAETILSIREGGRSNMAMLEFLGNGGLPKDYHVLDAVEIRYAARKACRLGQPCPQLRQSCLFAWYWPDPLCVHPEPSSSQKRVFEDCADTFHDLLQEKGFIE